MNNGQNLIRLEDIYRGLKQLPTDLIIADGDISIILDTFSIRITRLT